MAPELLMNAKEKHSKSSDIYSYGVVLYELCSRKDPFEGISIIDQMKVTTYQVPREEVEKMPVDTPPSLAQLISWCWKERTQRLQPINQAIEPLEKEFKRDF
jgi:serine/threonine protein kinase